MKMRSAVALATLMWAVGDSSAQRLAVSTLAGTTGGGGYADGVGTTARFVIPRALAQLPDGRVVIVDSSNHVIRMLHTDGNVITLAGKAETPGFANGSGDAARFRYPMGIAYDAQQSVIYVSDKDNHTIRRVTLDGAVTTIAGTPGTSGTADGSPGAFTYPRGIDVDDAGDIYVADTYNHAIRRVRAGTVSTVAGTKRSIGNADGFGSQAGFNYPYGIAFDRSTNSFFVSDTENETIRRVTPDGRVTTFAGAVKEPGSTDGLSTAARFNTPWGLAVDSAGNLFVADNGNRKIRRITPGGTVTTVAGSGFQGARDGDKTSALLNSPSDVALSSDGNILFVDSWNHAVRSATQTGIVSTIAGAMPLTGNVNGFGTAARFYFPRGVALDAVGNSYVVDYNDRVRKITPAGEVTVFAGSSSGSADGSATTAQFRDPLGIAIGPDGSVYVADTGNHTIRKITPQGVVSTLAGTTGVSGSANGPGSVARFDSPWAVAVDAAGWVYVADAYNHAVRVIEPAGFVTTFAGDVGVSGRRDGVGTAARFYYPLGIAVDSGRNIWVSDWGNNSVRKITQSGVVSTIAGDTGGSAGWVDGQGTTSRLDSPSGIAVDGAGNVYVSDSYNNVIRRIVPSGYVSTVAGLPWSPGNVSGVGTAARFATPAGLAVSADGRRIVIADESNSSIRSATFVAPSIEYFHASPQIIKSGEQTRLQYVVSDATTATITSVGPVSSSGGLSSVTVAPTVSTTYTLSVSGPGGVATATVTVLVDVRTRRRSVAK